MANAPGGRDDRPVTIFGPDFPFPFDDWIAHPAGLGSIPAERHGEEVAVIGAGISGLVAAYELMKLGVRPVVYEASQMGGRLRSQPFEGADGVVAELGGMRFPVSSTSFYHYVDKLGLQVAHQTGADLCVHDRGGAPAEVHRSHTHGFVHGHQKVAGPKNATLAA